MFGLPVQLAGLSVGVGESIRLPSYLIAVETIFVMPDQRLTIRHDAGSSAQPYGDDGLLAIRKVNPCVGVRGGLDSALDFT